MSPLRHSTGAHHTDRAPKYKRAIQRTLRAIATPDKIHDRGRMIGDFLLALDETKAFR